MRPNKWLMVALIYTLCVWSAVAVFLYALLR